MLPTLLLSLGMVLGLNVDKVGPTQELLRPSEEIEVFDKLLSDTVETNSALKANDQTNYCYDQWVQHQRLCFRWMGYLFADGECDSTVITQTLNLCIANCSGDPYCWGKTLDQVNNLRKRKLREEAATEKLMAPAQ